MEHFYIYVTPFFPSPSEWRGAYCFDFVKALKRELLAVSRQPLAETWRVVVFKPGDGGDYTVDGVTVHTFKEWKLPSGIFPFFFRRHNERSFLAKVRSILTTNHQPLTTITACHANTAEYAIYPLALKAIDPEVKTILHHHDPQSFGLNGGVLRHCALYNAWLFRRLRKIFEEVDIHVFISEMVKRSFLSAPDTSWTAYENYRRQMRGPRLFRCRPVRIKQSIVLHNGVDTTIFHPATTNHRPLIANHSVFTIGCVANLEDWKDPITFVRACVLVQKELSALQLQLPTTTIKLIVVGSGADVPMMEQIAAEGGLDLEIRREVDHAQLPAFYRELDLFVLPSYFEGFGCVFMEAYACGVPFITCEGQGMDDLISDQERSFWLCKQRDPKDLAQKIVYFIRHRPEQHLKDAVDITTLLNRFVRSIGI